MLVINNLTYEIGERKLFDNAKASFILGERYALTGPNGAGKSTLFKIINSELNYEGSINYSGRISVLTQKIDEDLKELNLIDAVIQGNKELYSAFKERDELYMQECTPEVGIRLAELEEIIAELNGYTVEATAHKLLAAAGVDSELFYETVDSVSQSDQMKTMLVRAIASNPEILLLDEPSNGIDVFAVEWLKGFLTKTYKGLLIFISHDIDFVNSVCTSVADVDYESITIYPGNYNNMIEEKAARRDNAEKHAKTIEKKTEKISSFITRFGAGTRATQAKSKQKQLEKISVEALKKSNIISPYIRFAIDKQSVLKVVETEDLAKEIEGAPIFKNVDLNVTRGEKIAIIGKNNSGKSLLAKILAQLDTEYTGIMSIGNGVSIGYLPQYHEEVLVASDREKTVIEWVSESKAKYEEARNMLGRMLFSGDDVHKTIKVLSGGEMARCILAKIMLSKPNLIILDEPCSHLDLASVEAFKTAILEAKNITFIVSTNDQMHTVCDRLVILNKGSTPDIYIGALSDYIKQKE